MKFTLKRFHSRKRQIERVLHIRGRASHSLIIYSRKISPVCRKQTRKKVVADENQKSPMKKALKSLREFIGREMRE